MTEPLCVWLLRPATWRRWDAAATAAAAAVAASFCRELVAVCSCSSFVCLILLLQWKLYVVVVDCSCMFCMYYCCMV